MTGWITHDTQLSDRISVRIESVIVDSMNKVIAALQEGAIIISLSVEARI
jgi:hypothetical protein